jgi:hypothetical protein
MVGLTAPSWEAQKYESGREGTGEYSSHWTCAEGSVGSWVRAFSSDWAQGVYKPRILGGWFCG